MTDRGRYPADDRGPAPGRRSESTDRDRSPRVPAGRRDPEEPGAVPQMSGGRHRRPSTRDAEPAEFPARPGQSFTYPDAEARTRAKLMNPERAYAELIEDLKYTYTRAGKPSLSLLGDQVDYSKATLSKVFSGKAMPSWVLVRSLGRCFRVAPAVLQEWYVLWTAANMHGRKPGTARGRATVPAPAGNEPARPGTAGSSGTASAAQTGYTCTKCGSWVVETTLHTDWHMTIDPFGGTAPPSESITGWNARSDEISLIREALGDEKSRD